jgi:hypothetical protein
VGGRITHPPPLRLNSPVTRTRHPCRISISPTPATRVGNGYPPGDPHPPLGHDGLPGVSHRERGSGVLAGFRRGEAAATLPESSAERQRRPRRVQAWGGGDCLAGVERGEAVAASPESSPGSPAL